MAESADKSNMCSSCFSRTKYSCLKCRNNFCMRCSVFENDEDTPGWRAGKSVAHCEVCFEEKMKNQQERGACDSDGGDETAREREPTTNTSVSSSSRYLFGNIEDVNVIETFDDCFVLHVNIQWYIVLNSRTLEREPLLPKGKCLAN